jgi:hypothetical protein
MNDLASPHPVLAHALAEQPSQDDMTPPCRM